MADELGDYTLRGPRVFYDLTTDRAIVLDAVFHSWDIKQKVPIYVRAESLRQLSRTQWSATNARLTTSEFHEPHFAIGMNKLVVTQHDNEDQPTQFSYVANDTSLNIGNTPVFGWPTLSGDATKPPIRAIDVGYDSQNGAEIQTRWDIFALMDKRPPDGLDASLLIDGFSRRGASSTPITSTTPARTNPADATKSTRPPTPAAAPSGGTANCSPMIGT